MRTVLLSLVALGLVLVACCSAPAEDTANSLAIKVSPEKLTLQKGQAATVVVKATFADGSEKDVTAVARYQSQDSTIAAATVGKITAQGYGETAVAATYLHRSAVVKVAVPQSLPNGFPDPGANNKIDDLVNAKLKELGIPPSGPCTDQEFLRRAFLDAIGTLPKPEETRAFLADTDRRKRTKLIDQLLERPEYADYWTLKWGDLLRMKSETPVEMWPNAVQAYRHWVHEAIMKNMPYDRFATELITATGSSFRDPPSNFYRGIPELSQPTVATGSNRGAARDPAHQADAMAVVFMGVRTECMRCHAHPTEGWTPNDHLAFSAFFAQVAFKQTKEYKEEIVCLDVDKVLTDPVTKAVVRPKPLGGEVIAVAAGEDARVKLAVWLTAPENPWFANCAVNRVWYWLMGRGVVHEPDDLRPTNPPSNPQLLAYLAGELVGHKYDLKHIFRLILNSRTYQRSSQTAGPWTAQVHWLSTGDSPFPEEAIEPATPVASNFCDDSNAFANGIRTAQYNAAIGSGAGPALDDNGWPTGDFGLSQLATLTYGDSPYSFPNPTANNQYTGVWTISFMGTAEVYTNGGRHFLVGHNDGSGEKTILDGRTYYSYFQKLPLSALEYDSATGTGWNRANNTTTCLFLLTAEGQNQWCNVGFKNTDRGGNTEHPARNGLTHLQVMMPTDVGSTHSYAPGTVFSAPYLALASPYTALRNLGKCGTTVNVQLRGVNLPQPTMDVKVPPDGPRIMLLETTSQGLTSNRVKFEASELEETSEIEPNNSPEQANRLGIGSVVNGRIDKPGDLDYFVFKAAAQPMLVFEVRARRLDSPLDSVITPFDSKGQKLAQNDDIENADEPPLTHQADSRLEFKAPADGEYVLRISDAQRKGGEEYAYRLNIMPDRPDFDVRLVSDLPQRLAAGDTAAATVAAIRRGGYNGEIRLALKDAPTGFVMRGGVISQKRGWEDGSETRLTITAPADAAVGILTPRIVATAQIDGKEVVRPLVPTRGLRMAGSPGRSPGRSRSRTSTRAARAAPTT